MATQADLYEVLQVHPAAEAEVVQAAFRRLAQKYHPDVNPGPDAQQRMAQLNQAYAVLGDPAKRAAYDKQRRGGVSTSAGIPPGASGRAVAQMQVIPTAIDFGNLPPGHARTVTLRIQNTGGGTLSGGMVVCRVGWLKVTPDKFNGNDADIVVRFQPDRNGQFRSPQALEVYSNGGRVAVTVSGTCGAEAAAQARTARPEPPRSAGTKSGGYRTDGPAGSSVQRQPYRAVARAVWKPMQVNYVTAVAMGTVVTTAVWSVIAAQMAIALPLPFITAGLGMWLLWRRYFAERARKVEAAAAVQRQRAPNSLGRCGICGFMVEPRGAHKCAHCGGTICPHCNSCPCGRSRSRATAT